MKHELLAIGRCNEAGNLKKDGDYILFTYDSNGLVFYIKVPIDRAEYMARDILKYIKGE
jgi:hypothetical protein